MFSLLCFFFFFQAEDGIRDVAVTGVQTCALPISAALRDRRFAFDMVRPGVFLYGGSPGEGFPEPRAVVSVRARVVAVRRVAAGESVSYNALWRATRGTTVATLGIGYADGVRRAVGLSGRGAALLGGRRCPIVGEIGRAHV